MPSLGESREFDALLQITRAEGSDDLAEDLAQMLFSLNAPPRLTKFLYLCKRQLPNILEFCGEVESDGYSTRLLDPAKRWLEWFNANTHLFDGQPITHGLMSIPPKERHKNPLHGWGLQLFAYYAALFHKTENEEMYGAWARLALLLWLAQASVLHKYFTKDNYKAHRGKSEFLRSPYSIYNAGRGLRQLSSGECEEYLYVLDSDKSIMSALADISERWPHAYSLYVYVQKALADKPWITRSGGGGGGRRGINLPPGYIDLGDNVEIFQETTDAGFSIVDVPGQPFTPEEIDVLIDIDIDPGELVDGGQLSLLSVDCETTNKNVMSRVLAARGRQQHLRMQNQLLPFQFYQLTLGEVIALYKYLVSDCERVIKGGGSVDKIEVPLLLLVMLVTGSTVTRAAKLSVLKPGQKNSSAEIYLYPHRSSVDGVIPYEWGVRAFEPHYATDPIYESTIRKRKVKSFFLPDFLGVGPMVAWYKSKSDTINKRRQDVFQKPIEVYERHLKAYLKSTPKHVSDRLTITNVGKYLLHQIVAITNDITAASCITAQGHSLAGTRIHYSVLSVDYLRGVMKSAIEPLLRGIGKAACQEEFARVRNPAYVGARHCVNKESYKKAVESVIRDIRTAKSVRTLEELVEHHNLYTAYTVWMFNFGIAGRGNRSPLLETDQIDLVSCISTYRDKDIEQPYHARLIWLPPELIRQLSNYKEHLSAVKSVLMLYKDAEVINEYPRAGFFLKNDLKHNEIRAATMSDILYKKYLNAPHNSHRRFIRSELVEMGHPIESIDALMGHWFTGEEPWSYFSSFGFDKHIELLKQNIGQILNQLGFRVCRSNLVTGKH